jgi:MFS family permease
VITLATIGCALTSMRCALAPTLSALVIARLLAGATAGALIPLSLAWIGDSVPYERRQSVLARYLIGQMFGIALGQVLGGIGADYLGAGRCSSCSPHGSRRPRAHVALRLAVGGSARDAGSVATRFAAVLRSRGRASCCAASSSKGCCSSARSRSFPRTCIARTDSADARGLRRDAVRRGRPRVRRALGDAGARLGEPGLACGGGILLFVVLHRDRARIDAVVAVAACLVAGLGFYMLHNTLQVNATQMAPAQRGSSLALFACTLFTGIRSA